MKKIAVLLVLLSTFGAYSQELGDSEVHVGVSDATLLDLASSFGDLFSDAITSGITGAKIKDAKSKQVGMFELGYRYNLSKKIKIGADINYMKIDRTFNVNDVRNTRSTTYLIVMPSAEFSYIKSSRLNFYGSVSAGYANASTKEKAPGAAHYSNNSGTFAYQVNPLGLNWSVVDDKLGLFVEIGLGYKGIGLVGVSYKI